MSLLNLSAAQLRRAALMLEEIETLNAKLAALEGSKATPVVVANDEAPRKRKMSAAGRARVIAAQKKRWAKIKAAKKA
jgi:hypothetical protein